MTQDQSHPGTGSIARPGWDWRTTRTTHPAALPPQEDEVETWGVP